MSETEHVRGKLIPTNKTTQEFIGDIEFYSYHSNAKEYFEDEFYEKAVEIDGKIFIVDKKEIDPYEDIFESKLNDDGSIDFELRYYSGGCGFGEAIDCALEKLTPNQST